ncbi:NEAT domain-containing protein [Caldifermentibacillus hisashii]|uniref:NEAT domain-containing protein n=1 Tax=Caldifermentibacillus hisashii TaxID=996558 RepID=UPI0031B7164D
MRKRVARILSVFATFLLLFSSMNLPAIFAETALADGEYTVDFRVLKDKKEETSMMDQYTVKPAILKVQDGKNYVSVTLKNSDWIKTFKVEKDGQYVDADVVATDPNKDTRVVQFEVADLAQKQNVQTHVLIPEYNYDGTYIVQFQFDVNNITPVKGQPGEEPGGSNPGEQPGGSNPGEQPGGSNPGEEPGGSNPGEQPGGVNPGEQPGGSNPGEQPGGVNPGEQPGGSNPGEQPGGVNPGEEPGGVKLENGTYMIDFTILKDGTDQPSMTNDYVVKPALLTVKDGKMDVSFTLKNSSWITRLQVERNGAYADVEERSKDEQADTRVVAFPIEDLEKKVNAKIKVDIPALNYHNTYNIQFAFDLNSIKPSEGKMPPVSSENPGGTNPKNNSDKLSFNRNDPKPTSGNVGKGETPKVANAKTADSAPIVLYMSLLLGSLTLLFWRNRAKLLAYLR